MPGFTAQSGLPLASAAIGVLGSKLRSFCVATTCRPAVRSDTVSVAGCPGSPFTGPISNRIGLGTGVGVGVGGRVGVIVGVMVAVQVAVGVRVGRGVYGGSVHPLPTQLTATANGLSPTATVAPLTSSPRSTTDSVPDAKFAT